MTYKKTILLVMVILMAAGGFLLHQKVLSKPILVMNDMRLIIADDAWVLGDKVFFRKDGHSGSMAASAVLHIYPEGVGGLRNAILKLKWTFSIALQKFHDAASAISMPDIDYRFYLTVLGILVGIGAAGTGTFFVLRRFCGASRRTPTASDTACADPSIEGDGQCRQQEVIVHHFLNIFKCQKGAAPDAKAMIRPVGGLSPEGASIYELRLNIEDEWVTRRMSIAPIGEDSGSRSRCYFVIYDDHLVVKIPPVPVTSFEAYIESIRKDNAIARKIAPRECLVPQVSVVLKKVQPLPENAAGTPDRLETAYLQWLKAHPAFESYLKIGDSYVFFMDLSKYFFLGHVLRRIHDLKRKTSEEVTHHADLVWRPLDFESRYGATYGHLSEGLQGVFQVFEKRLSELLQQHQVDEAVHAFQYKQWFLILLSGDLLSREQTEFKAGLTAQLNLMAKQLFEEYRQPVGAYRQMIQLYVRQRNLHQNKAEMSSLATNLLELLAWLGEKKVAMRDLKPDNLLIAGDPNRYPQFLESAGRYVVGLIDLETAVVYDDAGSQRISQPRIGGTPSFATPSHFLPNAVITTVFQDLALILHLQDWYALVGLLFQVVTGERLFHRTAKELLNVKQAVGRGLDDRKQMPDVWRQASETFWKHALFEFETKMRSREKRLRFIHFIPTRGSKAMLHDVLQTAQKQIMSAVHQRVNAQKVFTNPKMKKQLNMAHYRRLQQFQEQLRQRTGGRQDAGKQHQASALLEELQVWKKQLADVQYILKALKKPVSLITVYDLLEAMFTVVLLYMHQIPHGLIDRRQSGQAGANPK